jgi:hypothetical protein
LNLKVPTHFISKKTLPVEVVSVIVFSMFCTENAIVVFDLPKVSNFISNKDATTDTLQVVLISTKTGQFIIHYICREISIRKLILTQYDFAFNSSFISYHSLLEN